MTTYKIISCSSEDPVHPSSNLKNPDLYRSWQTNGYVKKATVDIAFPKPTKITLIDIGNAGSAFVEILVGKDDTPEDQYQVLVPIHSQMGVHDSRNGSNRTRTKCFEKFTEGVGSKEWTRMRVVCTQPFTNQYPFGLSYLYINQHNPSSSSSPSPSSSSSSSTTTTTSTSTSKNNKNKIESNHDNEDADTDVDEESKQEKKGGEKKKGEENIKRQNSELIKKLKNDIKQKNTIKPANDAEESDGETNNKTNNNNTPKNNGKLKKTKQEEGDEETNNNNTKQTKKQDDTKQKKDTPKGKDKPLNTILKGVVFVISGIQNPERSEIRDKGTSLGAVYKQDWDKECTHLICKFANTPKYNAVKAKGGIIATPQWILDCATKGKRLNLTKKYALEEDRPSLSSDSTAEKKKKKKKKKDHVSDPTKGYDSDSNDDSDGGPNEYDMRDSFIDTVPGHEFVTGDDEDFVPSDQIETSDEDLDELVRESRAFQKKNGGLQKRPRYKYEGFSDEDQEFSATSSSSSSNKHHKSDHKSNSSKSSSSSTHDSSKGKAFAKQHHKLEEDEKPSKNKHSEKPQFSEKPKHKINNIINNNASEEEDEEEKLTKHKSSNKPKPTAIHPASESEETEGMADEEVKANFKHLMADEDEVPQKKPKSSTTNDKNKQTKKIPTDDGSGTEEMIDNFTQGKTGKYVSDNSDSDGTQPLEKDELLNVIGALQTEAAGDGTLAMDAETNWEDFVNKKVAAKSKEKAALGKNYPIEKLPDFLSSVQSFFSGVKSKNEHLLRRYIIAYNGKIDDYLGDDTKYIFTERNWDRNFDDALKMNPDLVFVKPEWIFACHSKQAMVDVSRYVITNKK